MSKALILAFILFIVGVAIVLYIFFFNPLYGFSLFFFIGFFIIAIAVWIMAERFKRWVRQ